MRKRRHKRSRDLRKVEVLVDGEPIVSLEVLWCEISHEVTCYGDLITHESITTGEGVVRVSYQQEKKTKSRRRV